MRLFKTALLIAGLSSVALGGPVGPPGGAPILNQNFLQVPSTFYVQHGTIAQGLKLPYLTIGQCLTTDGTGTVISISCLSGGGGGGPNGTINNATKLAVPYYSVTGSSNAVSGDYTNFRYDPTDQSLFVSSFQTNVADIVGGLKVGGATEMQAGAVQYFDNAANNTSAAIWNDGATGKQKLTIEGDDGITLIGPVTSSTMTVSSLTVTSLNATGAIFPNGFTTNGDITDTAKLSVNGVTTLFGPVNSPNYGYTMPDGSIIISTTQFIFNGSNAQTATSNISSGTYRTALQLPYLTPAQCITTDATGKVVNVGCGGGTSSLALSTGSASNSIIVSSPTSNIVVDSNTLTGSLQGSTTFFLGVNTSSITAQGNTISLATLQTNQNLLAVSTTSLSASTVTLQNQANSIAVSTGALNVSTNSLQSQVNGKGVGTITGVVAGTGLTGGGTSGSVTLNLASATINNTSTLQSGATFYVSSGTVNSQLNLPYLKNYNLSPLGLGSNTIKPFLIASSGGITTTQIGTTAGTSNVGAGWWDNGTGYTMYLTGPADVNAADSLLYVQVNSSNTHGLQSAINGNSTCENGTCTSVGAFFNGTSFSGNTYAQGINASCSGPSTCYAAYLNSAGTGTNYGAYILNGAFFDAAPQVSTFTYGLYVGTLTIPALPNTILATNSFGQLISTTVTGGSGGGSSTTTVQLNGTTLSAQTTNFNFIPGTGLLVSGSTPTANNVSLTYSADTAVMLARATDQANTDRLCYASGASTTFACSMNPTLTAYTTGMCLTVVTSTNNVSFSTATLNVDTLGSKSILGFNGAALSTGAITTGDPLTVCLSSPSSTGWIIQGGSGSGSGGGSGTPGGSTNQIQYNNSGSFAGSSNFQFNGATVTVTGTGIPLVVTSSSPLNGVPITAMNIIGASSGTLAQGEGVEVNYKTQFDVGPLSVGYETFVPDNVTTGGAYGSTYRLFLGGTFLSGSPVYNNALTLSMEGSTANGGINLGAGSTNVPVDPWDVGIVTGGVGHAIAADARSSGGASAGLGVAYDFYGTDVNRQELLGSIEGISTTWSGSPTADITINPVNAGTQIEAMRVTGAGNVVIGTNTDTDTQLKVVGSTSNAYVGYFSTATVGGNSVAITTNATVVVTGSGNGAIQLTINSSTYGVVSASTTPIIGDYLVVSSTNGTVTYSTGTGGGSGGSGGGSGSGTVNVTPQYQIGYMALSSSNVITSSANFTNNGTTITMTNMSQVVQSNVSTVTAIGVYFNYAGSSVTASSVTFPISMGTTSGGNAISGSIGEYISTAAPVAVAFPTTGNYGDLVSTTVTAGEWDLTAVLGSIGNGATVTTMAVGISSTTGNSAAGLIEGDSLVNSLGPTAATDTFASIPNFRVSLTASKTYYLKYKASFSIATPNAVGRLSARRIR